MKDIKSILVLAPHPDDGEFGAGASIQKWASEGIRVHYVAFSPCIKSLPKGSLADTLHTEMQAATKVLGIAPEDLSMGDFPVREFPAHRQAILEKMVRLNKKISPDLVLMPNSMDIHQDHQVIYKEGLRAFKHCSMLGYELPWNSLEFKSNLHVKVSKQNIEKKYKALSCYASQTKRNYHDLDFLIGLARVRGVQVGAEYAEAFELIRWISH
jgi:LmbE family N-acetylglucosaminyl deacetylase